MPYFNAECLPAPTPEYVAWIDVMGTQAGMSRSLNRTANFMFKLHAAAIQAPHGALTLYPVMDGLYVASPTQWAMFDFLRSIFQSVAEEFIQTETAVHRFLIRGALAFGPTIHGAAVPREASRDLDDNPQYRDSVLLGLPMVQAHLGEASAPPFGIFVHDSARSFAPAGERPIHTSWWRWNDPAQNLWTELAARLSRHFEWCERHSMLLDYRADRIKVHRDTVEQYFSRDW